MGGRREPKTRRDGNHAEIADLFRALYCSVHDTAAVGNGFPDLVVGVAGLTLLVEVKLDDGEPTPPQVAFKRDWRGHYAIVRKQQDVVDLVRWAAARGRR